MNQSFVLGIISIIHFILFIIASMTTYEYKVYFTQSLLTICLCLLILTWLAYNKLKNLHSYITYISFVLAIPFIFHLVFLALYSNDENTSGKAMKLYIMFGLMAYFSIIWYLIKN
jgi:hypothetical protein